MQDDIRYQKLVLLRNEIRYELVLLVKTKYRVKESEMIMDNVLNILDIMDTKIPYITQSGFFFHLFSSSDANVGILFFIFMKCHMFRK